MTIKRNRAAEEIIYNQAGWLFQSLAKARISLASFKLIMEEMMIPAYAKATAGLNGYSPEEVERFMIDGFRQQLAEYRGGSHYLFSPTSSGSFLNQFDPSNLDEEFPVDDIWLSHPESSIAIDDTAPARPMRLARDERIVDGQLGADLYRWLQRAIKTTGSYDPNETLPMIEESLTGAEYGKLYGFLQWVHENGRTIGSGNYEEVFMEYREAVADADEIMDEQNRDYDRMIGESLGRNRG